MAAETFNAVKFMRDTRDQLSKRYRRNPARQERDLNRVRVKYNKKFKRNAASKRLRATAVVER